MDYGLIINTKILSPHLQDLLIFTSSKYKAAKIKYDALNFGSLRLAISPALFAAVTSKEHSKCLTSAQLLKEESLAKDKKQKMCFSSWWRNCLID